jgi:hypothetical protein
MEGMAFVGPLADNSRDAQVSAAQTAVNSFAVEIAKLHSSPGGNHGKGSLTSSSPGGNHGKGMVVPPPGRAATAPPKGAATKGAAMKGAQVPALFPRQPTGKPPLHGAAKGLVRPTVSLKPIGKLTASPAQSLKAPAARADGPVLGSLESSKAQLNTFLQRFLGRPVTKEDWERTVERLEDKTYQATLTLHCLGDEVYVSEPASTEKEAVELAAKMALDEHAHDIEALPAPLTNNAKMKKRKHEALGLEGIPAQPIVQVPGQPTGPLLKTPKTELNTICQKMGMLTKGSVVYETTHGPEGFAAVVTIAGVCDIDGNNL